MLLLGACATGSAAPSGAAGSGTTTAAASGGATGGVSGDGVRPTTGPADASDDDPAVYASLVRRYADRADVGAQLLMTILYNESYKPHDPADERAWHALDPDSAFGLANMHEKAFDDVKRGRDFADRRFDELPDDHALAIEAAAWYLHDLSVRLPAHWSAPYSRTELLALGYDAGPGTMVAFAGGTSLLPAAADYLRRFRVNWPRAGAALAQTGT